MKKTKAEWFIDNWKEVLFAFFFLFVAIPAFIYHIATIDPELKNTNSRNQLEGRLAREMKQISLPSKTAINEFESIAKIIRFWSTLDIEQNSVSRNLLII